MHSPAEALKEVEMRTPQKLPRLYKVTGYLPNVSCHLNLHQYILKREHAEVKILPPFSKETTRAEEILFLWCMYPFSKVTTLRGGNLLPEE